MRMHKRLPNKRMDWNVREKYSLSLSFLKALVDTSNWVLFHQDEKTKGFQNVLSIRKAMLFYSSHNEGNIVFKSKLWTNMTETPYIIINDEKSAKHVYEYLEGMWLIMCASNLQDSHSRFWKVDKLNLSFIGSESMPYDCRFKVEMVICHSRDSFSTKYS